MSGYQTILQLSALAGFWGAYLSNSFFDDEDDLQWQIPVIVQLIPGILLLLGTLSMPETPRFLATKGRWTECEDALIWLRNSTIDSVVIKEEMSELREASSHALLANNKISFWKEALRKGVRARLGVGIGLMIAQNMVGLNALNYCNFSFPNTKDFRLFEIHNSHNILLTCLYVSERRTNNLHHVRLPLHLRLPLPYWYLRGRETPLCNHVYVLFC